MLVKVTEFQLIYFKSQKMMQWKCCTQYASKFGKLSSCHRTGKGQFSFQSQRKAMPKNVQTTAQLHSSHTLAMWYSKFFKQVFNNTWTMDFQMFKMDLEKPQEPEIKLPTTVGSSKKQESSREKSALLTTPKPVLITTNCGKFSKKWGYQTSWPASWEIYMQVKKQQLKLDTKQQNGSKLGKEGVKAVYCYPAYLTYMHSTSWEMQGWMNHKLESRLPGYMSITTQLTDDTSYTDDTTLMAESKEL